ncbi:hypothetical protein Maq22A_c21885 [Methylobacterium aquaticum]|jgi:hypothetical protein|uniref:Uncharacterized protein n=2 Tax=Methylobacterium TaxID=407 RepID=A0A0C6FVZ3_9HYPH|nr:hypothetical protein Maq22A_c21885 [Methylobacterium aquaticum]
MEVTMPDPKPMPAGGPIDRQNRDLDATEGDSLVDGRLDPDAQSPADEDSKPFDPKENDPS